MADRARSGANPKRIGLVLEQALMRVVLVLENP